MAIEYYDAVNGDGLFNIIGKAGHALNTLNTARGTTVPTEILDAVNQYKKKTDAPLQMDASVQGLSSAEASWRRSGGTLANQLRRFCENFLIEVVEADSVIDRPSLTESLQYLIDEMTADEYYVDPNVVGSSISADGGNSSTDLSIAVTRYNGDIIAQQNMLVETMVVEALSTGEGATLRILGETAVTDLLSEEWPGGSGLNSTVPTYTIADSIIGNPGFETATIGGLPDDWIVVQDTPSTIRLTVNTEQTIIISGTPVSGYYYIVFTDPISGNDYSTSALAYNASASDVQTALRLLPGLGDITVTSSGTTPNFTHTVVFTGVAGQVAVLDSIEYFNTGSIAHAITVAGDVGAVSGFGLMLEGPSDLHLYYPITPTARQLYAVSVHCRSTVNGDFTIAVDVVDGIAGASVPSQSGASIAATLTGVATTANGFLRSWFAVSDEAPGTVYLKISVESDADMVLDDVIVVAVQPVYTGGPTVVPVAGRIPPVVGDKWTIPLTNDGAGQLQTLFHRLFDMAGKRLLLPSTGTTNIPDSVIG